MVNLINELPYTANLAKANINRLVKLTYERSFRPGERHTVIATIREVNEKFGYIEFGHPLNIQSKKMECGAMAAYYADDYIDISFINDKELMQEWVDSYIDFHNHIIEIKGYDSCVENINKIKV